MGFFNTMFGHKEKFQQVPNQTPEGMRLLQQLMQQGGQNTDFNNIEDMYMNKFNQQTIPSIAERFTGMGGGQRSSAFQGALGNAGADLMSQLAALRSQYGLQQSQLGLTPQFENVFRPASSGVLQKFAGPGLAMGLGGGIFGRRAMNKWNANPSDSGMNMLQMLPMFMGGM